MATPADLEAIRDPSLPEADRLKAVRRVRESIEPGLRDAVLDALVHALNEQPGQLQGEILTVLYHLDAWLLVGVQHGLLVRARVTPGEVQLDENLACFDAELGRVVDLERVSDLVDELADPPAWLVQRARARQRP